MNWESPFITLFVGSLVRPLFLVVAAMAAVRLFRIQHPASQHAVWRAVLIGLLVVPVVSMVMPRVDIPILPAEESGDPAPDPAVSGASATVRASDKPDLEIHPLLLREQGVVRPSASDHVENAGSASATGKPGLTIQLSLIFYVYITGLLMFAAYYATGWLLACRLLRQSRSMRSLPIAVSEDVIVPAAVGLFRPRVILPVNWRDWSLATRRAVLAHEFAHIRRKDLVTSLLAHCVKCMLWFNPLVWWVSRKVSKLAEMACDAVALQKTTDPVAYSRALLDFAERVQQAGYRARVPGLAMVGVSDLQLRIDEVFALSKGGLRRLARPGRTLALAGVPLLWAASALGFSQAVVSTTRARASSAPVAPSPAPLISPDPAPEPVRLAAALPAPVEPAPTAAAPQSTPAVPVFLNDYCIQCHNAQRTAGGVALDRLAIENPIPDGRIWERVLRTLRGRSMPPAGMVHPDRAVNEAMIGEIELALDTTAAPSKWPVRSEPLSDEALALRLANFLWSAPPDDELLNVASRGVLKDPKVIEQQVQRMLADPKSRGFVTDFFGGWLGLSRLRTIRPSARRFPDFDEGLRDAMQRETEMFLDSQLRENRSALELITANYTFINDRLARHYGIPSVSGSEFRKFTWPDGRRAGLLGHAGILTLTSMPDRISPNLRGKWILTTILGHIPPDPPPMAPPFPEDEQGNTTPVRVRMEQLVAGPRCAACHVIMDPPGYALENFNAIGQWQDTDASMPVDASGVFPDGTVFNGPEQFRAALLDRRSAILNNIAEKLLTYALGRLAANSTAPRSRALEYYEMPAVRAIVQEAAPQNYSWSVLITGVVKSAPFQSRVFPAN